MAKESITGPGGGDVIRLGPATVRIIEDGSTTGHRLGIGEITVAPRSAGPPQHRHARHDEGFYVVSGTARFTIGTDARPAMINPASETYAVLALRSCAAACGGRCRSATISKYSRPSR